MKKLNKIATALLVASTAMLTSAFAQTEDGTWYSNSYKSTAQTIRTDAENYIDARYFSEVNFDKIFLNTNFSEAGLNLGVAKKFNDLYVAGFYNGNFWGNLNGYNNKTETNTSTDNKVNPDLNSNTKDFTQNLRNNTYNNGNSHKAIVLFGFPNKMGLKIDTDVAINVWSQKTNNKDYGYNENHNDVTTETIKTPQRYGRDNFSNQYNLNLVWSSYKIDKEKTVLQPWARLGLDMNDYREVSYYTETEKQVDPNNASNNKNETTDYKETNYTNFYPTLNINLGTDIALKSESKFQQLFNIEYGLKANIYGKNKDVSKTVFTDSLNPDNNSTSETITSREGKMDFTNSLNGTYRFDVNPIEKLTLAGRVGLGTSVRAYAAGAEHKTEKYNAKNHSYVKVDNEFVSENGVDKEVTYPLTTETSKDYHVDTAIKSNFGIGVKYAVKPNFVLNLGYSGYLPNININTHTTSSDETTKYDKDGNNVETINGKETIVETTTGNYASSLSTGFTWSMGDCCALDVAISISRTPSLKQVWDAGWNLGFTFKK